MVIRFVLLPGLEPENEGWEQYFRDDLHPNQQGYELLADSGYYGVLENLVP